MVQKALKYRGTMLRLKSMFFSQLTLLSNSLILMSYLGGIYLQSCFTWLWGRSAENIEEKKKTDRRKTLKSEDRKKKKNLRKVK